MTHVKFVKKNLQPQSKTLQRLFDYLHILNNKYYV